jgi:uncharacterized membrane protein
MDSRSIGQFLLPFAMLASLVPVGVALFRTRPLDRPSWAIALAVFVSLVFNEIMMQVAHYRAVQVAYFDNRQLAISTYPVMHAFLVVQSFVLSRFYVIAFAEAPRLAWAVTISGGLVLVYTLLNAFPVSDWVDGWNQPASRSLAVQSFFFILLAMIYLYRLFARSELVSLEQTPLFWFNAGIFIYFSVSFFAFIYWRILLDSGQSQWSNLIHQGANIVLNAFYTIGLLCKPPTSRTQT